MKTKILTDKFLYWISSPGFLNYQLEINPEERSTRKAFAVQHWLMGCQQEHEAAWGQAGIKGGLKPAELQPCQSQALWTHLCIYLASQEGPCSCHFRCCFKALSGRSLRNATTLQTPPCLQSLLKSCRQGAYCYQILFFSPLPLLSSI